MANQFVTIQEKDLGGGIDALSAENQIPEGYVENLQNMDPLATGQVKTRVGYQGYLGNVPVRVNKIEYTDDATNNLLIYLDGSISLSTVDLTNIASTPLIILGKTSADNTNNAGDFPNNSTSIKYYSGFTVQSKKLFATGTQTLTIAQEEHGFSTNKLYVQLAESTSETNSSNSLFLPDSISIDSSSYDITITYTNNTGSSFSGYVIISDKSAVGGEVYVSSATSISTGSNDYSISAATHGLTNFNIIPKLFQDTGTALIEILPDAFVVDSSGNVTATINNQTGATFNCVFILNAAPLENIVTGSVAANDSVEITISDLTKPYLFVSCYLEQTVGGSLELVFPESIDIDASTGIATLTFQNNSSSGRNFQVYFEEQTIATNKLAVSATVIAGGDVFTDNTPQLTIYGLPHSELYGSDREPRQGWVNHIDSYKSTGEDRLICGLGGNLFSAQLESENNNSTDYLMPTLYPDIRGRVASDLVIGPAFVDSTDTSSRTRGYISATTAGVNLLQISTVTYQSGTGYLRYRLSAPGLAVNGTLSTIISTTTGLEDILTVTQMGYSRLNGSFTIKAVTQGSEYLDIDVENDSVDSSDYNETDCGGLAGIFTDRLTLTATSKFIADDTVDSEIFDDYSVVNSSGTTVLFNDCAEEVSVPAGLRISGTRTCSVLPLRELDGTASVENLVRGDMLSYQNDSTGLLIDRQLRVKYINVNSDISVTVSGDGEEATVTLGSGTTSNLYVGQAVLIRGTTSYNGEQTITDITSSTEFKFSSEEDTSESGTLVGKTVNLDESLEIADTAGSTNSLTVVGRWVPIEAPESTYDLPPTTRIRYFDSDTYTNQSILRSVMVQDNLYLTNGNDEVLKYDGENLYRAGLPRWQPHLFCSTDTTATGVIVLNNPSISKDGTTAPSANRFVVAIEDQKTFPVGTQIEDSTTSEKYRVIATDLDSTNAYIITDRSISGPATGGTLTKVSSFKYYFRLNSVDTNNNLIASAIVGSDDFVVEMSEDAAVYLKLVGMPVLDNYDFDRLEVEIYRTKSNQSAPFYKLTTLPLSFNNNTGYLTYTDTASDEDLINLDAVSTALEGAELGTGWSEPLRAKYCTSADNRLILANITDYPTIDLQINQNTSGTITAAKFTTSGNHKYLFRKDSDDSATATNMVDRINFEFVSTSGAVSITPATDITESSTDILNIASTAHGLAVKDWVYLYHSAVQDTNNLTFAGWYQIYNVPDADNFRIRTTEARAGTTADVDRYICATAQEDIPVLLGTDGNYSMLNGNRSSTEPYEFLAIRRLANAINSVMRKADVQISGQESFTPWMIASAGNEFSVGQLIIKQPKVFDTAMELVLPALTGDFDVYVNSVKRSASSSAGSIEKRFPSRLIASYPNFAEIFDRPTVQLDVDSQSAIDVNSADGQELTSVISFFAESAFGAAQKASVICSFKSNSIYLNDLAAKSSGNNPTQKIDSEGKGCTAPFSVAYILGGIAFANYSGIYRLNRSNLQVEYIGQKYERVWKEQVSKDYIDLVTATNYVNGNQYKLSIPVDSEENNNVAVYNHTREYQGKGMGSWTTYTNHPVTGWANLVDDSYFATTEGQVFSIRRTGELTDYRDDSDAISYSLLTRAMDFGDAGVRKHISYVISNYRTLVSTDNITLKSGIDLVGELEDTDEFSISREQARDNLSDIVNKKVISIRSSLRRNVGNYLQLEYSGSAKDEPLELAGISIRVAGKNSKGIMQAVQTR